jgi:hypothetical protein
MATIDVQHDIFRAILQLNPSFAIEYLLDRLMTVPQYHLQLV